MESHRHEATLAARIGYGSATGSAAEVKLTDVATKSQVAVATLGISKG